MITRNITNLCPVYETASPEAATAMANWGADNWATRHSPAQCIVLRIADLPPACAAASYEDVIEMMKIGEASVKIGSEKQRAKWEAEMSAEEGQRIAMWRAEGRAEAVEEFKRHMAELEVSRLRLATVEATVDDEVSKRLEGLRKDWEIASMREMAALRERLAVAETHEETLVLQREKTETLEKQRDALQSQLLAATVAATRSSRVIGKQGETTVWDLLETEVVPEFPYAEVRNMSGVSHAADFHLWVMLPDGVRMKTLIDVKKYKRPVKSDEIKKLHADVDADEKADCGIMLSLTSGICTMKQFQIQLTDGGKPVLYISFADTEETSYAKLLCVGIRALMQIVPTAAAAAVRSYDAQRMEELLYGISEEMKELDVVIKTMVKSVESQVKGIESLRKVKENTAQRVLEFRKGPAASDEDVTPQPENNAIATIYGNTCVTVVKATGIRCGKPTFNGGQKCKHHTSRSDKIGVPNGGVGSWPTAGVLGSI